MKDQNFRVQDRIEIKMKLNMNVNKVLVPFSLKQIAIEKDLLLIQSINMLEIVKKA
jgi:hypothetical protein